MSKETFTTEGIIKAIYPLKQVSEKFSVQEFVLELSSDPRYPQYVKMQASGQRVQLLDTHKEGDKVEVTFNLRGREYTNRRSGKPDYFTTLDVWKIEKSSIPEGQPTTDEDIPF